MFSIVNIYTQLMQNVQSPDKNILLYLRDKEKVKTQSGRTLEMLCQ